MVYLPTNLKTNAIKQERLLYAILKTNKADLEDVIKNKELYYYSYDKIVKDKKGVVIYKNGVKKTRPINTTKGKLKNFQNIIATKILSTIPLPSHIKGGVKGGSNIANAQAHLGKHYKFKTDIKQYFPSISTDRVFAMFLRNGFSKKVATLLTHLTTNKHQLPQGTPTSTGIANLVFIPNDDKIIDYCKENDLTHTRYVDDLVFSSHFDFRNKTLDLVKFVIADGFRISIKKTMYRAGNMEITGVLTKQNILDATDEYKELIIDTSINNKKTEARKIYVNRIKATTKNS